MVTLGFIGAGRVATALAIRWYSLGYPVTGIMSKHKDTAESLARLVAAPAVTTPPQADILFLAVSDDALPDVAASLSGAKLSGAVVHTSGVHSVDIFGDGFPTGSFHPMYVFRGGTRLRGDEKMLVGIEASSPVLQGQLMELAGALGGQPALIQAGVQHKVLYHAGAVIASNYLVTLYAMSHNLLVDKVGIPSDLARDALLNIMAGVLENLRVLPPSEALTGPIARNDQTTIQKHLSALESTPYEAVYRELGQQTIAVASGLDDAAKSALYAVLNKLEKDYHENHG